jgi:WD40 repeat protein
MRARSLWLLALLVACGPSRAKLPSAPVALHPAVSPVAEDADGVAAVLFERALDAAASGDHRAAEQLFLNAAKHGRAGDALFEASRHARAEGRLDEASAQTERAVAELEKATGARLGLAAPHDALVHERLHLDSETMWRWAPRGPRAVFPLRDPMSIAVVDPRSEMTFDFSIAPEGHGAVQFGYDLDPNYQIEPTGHVVSVLLDRDPAPAGHGESCVHAAFDLVTGNALGIFPAWGRKPRPRFIGDTILAWLGPRSWDSGARGTDEAVHFLDWHKGGERVADVGVWPGDQGNGAPRAFDVTADGRWLAVAFDAGVRLFDATSAKLLATFTGSTNTHVGRAAVTFSANGRWLAWRNGNDAGVTAVNVDERKVVGVLKVDACPVEDIVFDGAADRAAVSGRGCIAAWDVAAATKLTELLGVEADEELVGMRALGHEVVTKQNTRGRMSTIVYSVDTGARTRTFDPRPPNKSHGCPLDAERWGYDWNGQHKDASGRFDAADTVGGFEIWDASTCQTQFHAPATDAVTALGFSDDGTVLGIGEQHRQRRWDVAAERFASSGVVADAPHPKAVVDGGRRWLWQLGPTLQVADVAGHVLHTIPLTSTDYAVGIDASGRRVALAKPDGVEIWDVDSKARTSLVSKPGTHAAVALSADGKLVAALDGKGEVHVIEATSRRVLSSWSAGWASAMAFGPDGFYLVLSAGDKRDEGGEVRDVRTGKLAGKLDLSNAERFAFTRDGKLLIGVSREELAIIDTATWKVRGKLALVGVTALALDPSGRFAAVGLNEGTIRFFRLPDGVELAWMVTARSEDAAAIYAGGKVELAGDEVAARRLVRCRLGTRLLPFDVCEARVRGAGLLGTALR